MSVHVSPIIRPSRPLTIMVIKNIRSGPIIAWQNPRATRSIDNTMVGSVDSCASTIHEIATIFVHERSSDILRSPYQDTIPVRGGKREVRVYRCQLHIEPKNILIPLFWEARPLKTTALPIAEPEIVIRFGIGHERTLQRASSVSFLGKKRQMHCVRSP